jgi:hypothetical protein
MVSTTGDSVEMAEDRGEESGVRSQRMPATRDDQRANGRKDENKAAMCMKTQGELQKNEEFSQREVTRITRGQAPRN